MFLSNNILFTISNSVDPDEMQHYAAFHLCLHYLQKFLFKGVQDTKRLMFIYLFGHSNYMLYYNFS